MVLPTGNTCNPSSTHSSTRTEFNPIAVGGNGSECAPAESAQSRGSVGGPSFATAKGTGAAGCSVGGAEGRSAGKGDTWQDITKGGVISDGWRNMRIFAEL